jgi:hypothetical protein
MTTKLDKTLKREITLNQRPYIVTLTPDGLKLTLKGKRKGQELKWLDLVSGEAALAVALNASLRMAGEPTGSARRESSPPPKPAKKRPRRRST